MGGATFRAPEMLCAAPAGREACHSDNGGPLFVEERGAVVQVGVDGTAPAPASSARGSSISQCV